MDASFHSILVPVDFSPHSAEALRYAATFADRFTALPGLYREKPTFFFKSCR